MVPAVETYDAVCNMLIACLDFANVSSFISMEELS
ncbi:hypothetical protein [Bradyrhizobium acaciae]